MTFSYFFLHSVELRCLGVHTYPLHWGGLLITGEQVIVGEWILIFAKVIPTYLSTYCISCIVRVVQLSFL